MSSNNTPSSLYSIALDPTGHIQTPAVSSYTESPAQTLHSLPSLLGPVYSVVRTSSPLASIDVLVVGSHLLQVARKSFAVSSEVT
jgi:hypothetical protein